MKSKNWYCRECLNPIMTFGTYEEAFKHVVKTGHGIWKKKEIDKK